MISKQNLALQNFWSFHYVLTSKVVDIETLKDLKSLEILIKYYIYDLCSLTVEMF